MNWRKLKISICGTKNKKKITDIEKLLDTLELTGNESKDRLILQEFIDLKKIQESIIYNGNSIVSYNKIISEYKKILKKGSFDTMSSYFYKFLYLDAGSIAHYNREGWLSEYNSLNKLKEFFLHNENGVNIINEQPGWKTDVIKIAKTILDLTKTHVSQNSKEEKKDSSCQLSLFDINKNEDKLLNEVTEKKTKEISFFDISCKSQEWDVVHVLSTLPATDCNWLSTANRATLEELDKALETIKELNSKEKGHKTRLTTITRVVNKRRKEIKN